MKMHLVLAAAFLCATCAHGGTLITPSFVVIIIDHDAEGVVSSDNVT